MTTSLWESCIIVPAGTRKHSLCNPGPSVQEMLAVVPERKDREAMVVVALVLKSTPVERVFNRASNWKGNSAGPEHFVHKSRKRLQGAFLWSYLCGRSMSEVKCCQEVSSVFLETRTINTIVQGPGRNVWSVIGPITDYLVHSLKSGQWESSYNGSKGAGGSFYISATYPGCQGTVWWLPRIGDIGNI